MLKMRLGPRGAETASHAWCCGGSGPTGRPAPEGGVDVHWEGDWAAWGTGGVTEMRMATLLMPVRLSDMVEAGDIDKGEEKGRSLWRALRRGVWK